MTTSAAAKKRRPKYLTLPAILLEIRLPWPARVSILHRISGALLVFPLTAWLLYMLDASLASEPGFEQMRGYYLRLPLVKLALIVFAWAFFHHLLAGIRFLLLDLNKGIELQPARASAIAVLVASLLLTLVFAMRIW
ncbi:MAG TPA: succinate dehydrogenase, cytochrome b556 subunit [Ramlibacter sp.]|nr:succinate dehydrogenase, cytochrome b556 subunit [Ramlibacter sp.]